MAMCALAVDERRKGKGDIIRYVWCFKGVGEEVCESI